MSDVTGSRPRQPGLALALALMGTTVTQAQQPAAARPSVAIGRATSAIRLDGRLEEPAWAAADSIGALTQIEPTEGVAPSARTIVRVIADGESLIIGVRADDPEPTRITAFARARDADLSNEDHVKLVIDSYLDGRSGMVFAVNPNGARYDALVINQGEGENANWDALWEAATARSATGWSVEIRLPARSLLFRRGLESWGFNVQRRVQRLQQVSRWSGTTRDVKIGMTSRAGLLTGVPAFDLGLGLSVRPAMSGGAGYPSNGADLDRNVDASLDVTQRVGANSLASLTVNTDFAETEVDTRRTNLTRFPLVFPEKRTFFLEGSDIFDFGLGSGDDARTFFSRRIGLLNGNRVPIDAGLKLNGRQGGTSFGALAVRTRDAGGPLAAFNTSSTMGVARIRQNILNESSVGAIATFGDPIGRANSWVAGPDFTYQTSRFRGDKNFLVGAWALAMDRDSLPGRKSAFGAKIDYPNDLWDIALTYKNLGDGFDPSLGFVPRPGAQITNFNVNFMPRPKQPILGMRVRTMLHELLTTLVTDPDGTWESYRIFTAPINWRFESGDRFEINAVPIGERLRTPFEISDGVEIPAGTYRWTRYRLEQQFASKRKLSGQVTWWFGDFYTGKLDEYIITAAFKPSALFIVEFNATRNVGRLAEGDFTQQVVGTRFRVNVSPDLQFNSYMQYDNSTHAFGTNTRVRWTFSPVGDLFVVYNHNVNELLDAIDRRRGWGFASNQLIVKVQYAFRY